MKLDSNYFLRVISALLFFVVLYLLVDYYELADLAQNIDAMVEYIRQLGLAGPLLVIALMILAIVFNPLPSAPIALAAGAVYGHTWGTVYIIIGATSGALIAFMIARLAGYQAIKKMLPENWSMSRARSQNAMMVLIFISRLIPFLSFDLISYGAGLTPISLWRFFLATLLGLVPASFLLAHFGGEMIQADLDGMALLFLSAGLLTLPPLIYALYHQRKNYVSGKT